MSEPRHCATCDRPRADRHKSSLCVQCRYERTLYLRYLAEENSFREREARAGKNWPPDFRGQDIDEPWRVVKLPRPMRLDQSYIGNNLQVL